MSALPQCPDCNRDLVIVGGVVRCVKCRRSIGVDDAEFCQLAAAGQVVQQEAGAKVGKKIADGLKRMKALEGGDA